MLATKKAATARKNLLNKTSAGVCFALMFSAGSALIAPGNAMADDTAKGKAVFNGAGACMSCHGVEGKGDGPAAAALNPKPASFANGAFRFDTDNDGKTGTATDVFNVITNGAQKYGGSVMMAGRADLPEEDRRALAAYVLSLKQ